MVISLLCITLFLSMLLSFPFENRAFRIWLKLSLLKDRNTFVISETKKETGNKINLNSLLRFQVGEYLGLLSI